jgi:anti-sigma regulatory factor (Ser/Thr protein kinase)
MVAFAEEHSADRDLRERVALAFTEAFTNAVRHAYGDAAPSHDDIRVSADVDDGTLEIVVIDRGAGFRPVRHPRAPHGGNGALDVVQPQIGIAGRRRTCPRRRRPASRTLSAASTSVALGVRALTAGR